MENEEFRSHFTIDKNNNVTVEGIPELACYDHGFCIGEDVVSLSGAGRSLGYVNLATGKIRHWVTENGFLLVDDKDIDYEKIKRSLENSDFCVSKKFVEYSFCRYTDFDHGLNALDWTTYPDGMYFADSDGYGMEDNQEENVYCIINSDFEILVPFQPMNNVRGVLDRMKLEREGKTEPEDMWFV